MAEGEPSSADSVAAHAVGAMLVGASAAVTAIPVGASFAIPRCAMMAAPVAAARPGVGMVITGTRSCSDRRWVIIGIAAPPPTVATAARLAAGIWLPSNTSARASRKPANGSVMTLSSSALVI